MEMIDLSREGALGRHPIRKQPTYKALEDELGSLVFACSNASELVIFGCIQQ
jgi:hypothetical protein